MMKRAFILVMDSFGIGASADAADFGDSGADTFGHIAEAAANGQADKAGLRRGPLHIPNLMQLGLGKAWEESCKKSLASVRPADAITGIHGFAAEQSRGKDTPSGHWEIAGVPVSFEWGVFARSLPCFPAGITNSLMERCHLPGVLGNKHASGTEIIKEFGEDHMASGKPICYTSADSVFQIAAHEETFGLQRLYEVCQAAKDILEPYNIARVIARPFIGQTPETFKRTPNRRDLTTPPPDQTLLDCLVRENGAVFSIGKIADIFANKGISCKYYGEDNQKLFDALLQAESDAGDKTLVFANFVDFDMLYGHRRDIAGYAGALEAFDLRLPEIQARLRPGDLVLITADHGCDPSWGGSDHTREHVPVLFFGPGFSAKTIGGRESFADMGQTIAQHLGIPPLRHGKNCL